MKHIILIFIYFIFAFNCKAINIKKIPSEVLKTVDSILPNSKIKWKKNDNIYEAKTHINKLHITLYLNSKGNLIFKEEDVNVVDIPKNMRDTLIIYDIKHIIKFTDYEYKEVYYEVYCEQGKKMYELTFNENGECIQSSIYKNKRGYFIFISVILLTLGLFSM